MAGAVSKESIDSLTRQINSIKKAIELKTELKEQYRHLLSMTGIGKVLAFTIMLETGPICRFEHVMYHTAGKWSQWISNGKSKGKGNEKNGNKYLAWAFSDAVEIARRFGTQVKDYYNRKL